MLGQCNFMALAGHHMKAITSWPVRTAETGLRQPGISPEYYHYGSEQQGTETDPAHIPPKTLWARWFIVLILFLIISIACEGQPA